MEAAGRRNNLLRVLDSVESATIVGTSRRPGQTVARAQGITEIRPSSIAGRRNHCTPFFMRVGAPPAHERLSRNCIPGSQPRRGCQIIAPGAARGFVGEKGGALKGRNNRPIEIQAFRPCRGSLIINDPSPGSLRSPGAILCWPSGPQLPVTSFATETS